MTVWVVVALVSVALAVLAGWGAPALAARFLVPTLEASGLKVTNWRGRRVPVGLGLVLALWAISVAAVSNVYGFALRTFAADALGAGAGADAWAVAFSRSPFAASVVFVPVLVVVGSVALGLADDAFGDRSIRGFRGHLSALAAGRLTTGMVKLLGIGMLAMIAATGIAAAIGQVDSWVTSAQGGAQQAFVIAAWVLATIVIALSANLVNLTDLRPGRALKAYAPLALAGAALCSWSTWTSLQAQMEAGPASGLPTGPQAWVWIAGFTVCLLTLVVGPVVALWRYDLGERAMLGDAGANALGALAGVLLARFAPLWLLAALALVLFALNLASESVSFSSVIERVPVLRWLDGLGRLPSDPVGESVEAGSGADGGTRAGGPAATDDDARRDDVS